MIYNVSFPKIGVNLKINPVAFDCGGFSVKWYGIIIAIGFLLGFFYIIKRCESFKIKKSDIENIVIFSSILAIVCARIYYVIFYPGDYYIKNPSKILLINEGGIAIYGAVIGGIIAIFAYCKIKHLNIYSVLDVMSLGLVIGQTIGRWGNFTNQEAFGEVTDFLLGMSSENTQGLAVHPCFLYESFGCLLCFLVLHFYSTKKKFEPGKIFFIYTAIYGFIRMLIENLRTDSLFIPNTNLKVSLVLSAVVFVFSVLILKFKYKSGSIKK